MLSLYLLNWVTNFETIHIWVTAGWHSPIQQIHMNFALSDLDIGLLSLESNNFPLVQVHIYEDQGACDSLPILINQVSKDMQYFWSIKAFMAVYVIFTLISSK